MAFYTSLAFIFSIIAVVLFLFFLYKYRRIRPDAKIAVMEDQEGKIKVPYIVHDIKAYDAGEAAVVRHMNKVNEEEAVFKIRELEEAVFKIRELEEEAVLTKAPRPGGGHYGEGRPGVNLALL
jgi:predicted RND superfamily exporter protein